ncbi:DUF4145 domain-containing protein [Marinomonas rhizomae]|uniref:DUF4145 domain-containing protein n=1 Tax=Marinomonas rhizomae TaxID=491948 RepID=UPI0021066739|nr:DUF4145 domain-containing protein [Marinomonas rhizomae]UTV98313.1 DUF4145 domain-containing protein [Marinomonas rhizomae]
MTDRVKIYCNTCKGETNHNIKSTHDQSYHEEFEDHGQRFLGYCEETKFSFLVCRGCDSATLQERWTCSGMHDHNGDEIYSYNYHPKRKNLGEREVKKFHHVDKKLNDSYKEIITAFQQGLEIVTAMGVRALLEGICVIEGIDDKAAWGLTKKIEKLKDSQNIPDSIIDGLNGLKFIGDDAAHRLNATDKHTLSLSIDLLESLLTHLYEARIDLERKAEMVRKTHNKQRQSDA